MLSWGRQILADYDSLREDLVTLCAEAWWERCRLGVIPAAMPAVSFRHGAVLQSSTRRRTSRSSHSIRAPFSAGLDAFELDGGITYLENEPLENVRRLPLYREHYVFVTRREHPLGDAQQPHVDGSRRRRSSVS